jgi:hypothetical protein
MNILKVTLAAAFALGFSTAAYAQDLSFVLKNQTSSEVTALQISTVSSESWEENLIAGYVLPAGNQVDVSIADGASVCEYDIKVTFGDGSTIDDRDINLCDLGEYTVHE